MKNGSILYFLTILLTPLFTEANDLEELKKDLVARIEQIQQKFGEAKCCAMSGDIAAVFSQFNQSSKDFISLSMYQKVVHQCRLVQIAPDNIRMPAFKQDQIEFEVIFDCNNTLTGYKNEFVLQMFIGYQSEERTLDLIGICEHQKDSIEVCQYNYFKQPYTEYDQAYCPFYKSNKAYALYQSYLKYKKDNLYPEFNDLENSLWIQTLRDTFKKNSEFEYSQEQQQQDYNKAVKSVEKTIEKLRVTDKRFQQQLIADQALSLARQYENKYFVSMDLVKDIEADMKQIRRILVDSGNTYIPLTGVNREDVRTIRVESPINEKLYFKSGMEKLFENGMPEKIDCINQFWGFNQPTIHAVKESWDSSKEPWKFHMTLAGKFSSFGMQFLEYIEHEYFENYPSYYLFQRAGICNVSEYPKLALAKLDNGEQLYVYSSGDGDCPSGCIEKYYTNFRSLPIDGKVNPANNIEVPKCNYDENTYRDFFSY